MRAFWRSEITLRKLRVLLEWLPQDAPTRWASTDNRPFTTADSMLWMSTWALMAVAQGLAGKNASPFKDMPQYPWVKPKNENQKTYGSFGDHTPEEVADYLDSL